MRSLLPVGVVLAALSGGCAMSLPESTPYPHAPTASDPSPGMSLCARTAIAARSLSSAQAAGGWTLGTIGVLSTGTGAIATVVNDQQPRLMAAAGLMLGGVALGIVAYNLFLRSAASARLAQTADLALLDKHDHRAFETCVRARAAWEGSKTDAEAITREQLDHEERENRRLQEEIERIRKTVPEERRPPEPAPR